MEVRLGDYFRHEKDSQTLVLILVLVEVRLGVDKIIFIGDYVDSLNPCFGGS